MIAAGFIGILVFVLFTASIAGEFSQGTLRALLTRQPRRARLMIGKLAALLRRRRSGSPSRSPTRRQSPTQPPSRFSAQA